MRQGDALCIFGGVRVDQNHLFAVDKFQPFWRQKADPEFGPLEIGQNGNGALALFRQRSDSLDPLGVILVGPMGEIDAGDSHSRLHEGTDGVYVTGSWTEGAYDFGLYHRLSSR
jgi:hypothetical protein